MKNFGGPQEGKLIGAEKTSGIIAFLGLGVYEGVRRRSFAVGRGSLSDDYAVSKAKRIDSATAQRRLSCVQSRAVPARETADRR